MKKINSFIVVAIVLVFGLINQPENEKRLLFEAGTVKGVYTDGENHILRIELENSYTEEVRVAKDTFLRYKEGTEIRLIQEGIDSDIFITEKGDIKIAIYDYLQYGWHYESIKE